MKIKPCSIGFYWNTCFHSKHSIACQKCIMLKFRKDSCSLISSTKKKITQDIFKAKKHSFVFWLKIICSSQFITLEPYDLWHLKQAIKNFCFWLSFAKMLIGCLKTHIFCHASDGWMGDFCKMNWLIKAKVTKISYISTHQSKQHICTLRRIHLCLLCLSLTLPSYHACCMHSLEAHKVVTY